MAILEADAENSLPDQQELLISADSHVDEPPDLWAKRMPANLRDQMPPLQDRSKDLPGATDPVDRLPMMLKDTVSAEVIFPSLGNKMFAYEDVELQEACFRVYNDWIVEYRSVAPDRLVVLPCISTHNIDHAIAELERCTGLGTKGALLWHVPPKHLGWRTDHYDRLWAAAQAMGEPIVLHTSSGFSYNLGAETKADVKGLEYYRGSVNLKMGDVTNGLFDLIYYGVFERFPNLKLLYAEFEIGWIPWFLQQWDFYVKHYASSNPLPNTLLPSEYFERNIFATFQNDPLGARNFKDGWGINKCMWASDFPHGGTTWPNSRDVITRDLAELDALSRARLMSKNVAEMFRFDLPTTLSQTKVG